MGRDGGVAHVLSADARQPRPKDVSQPRPVNLGVSLDREKLDSYFSSELLKLVHT
jgi:hypothetical protein